MSHWKTQSFVQKSTSKPLRFAVAIIFVALVGTGAFAYFYKVHQVVVAESEIISADGEIVVDARAEGELVNFSLSVGESVKKDQVVGQIKMPLTDLKSLKSSLDTIHSIYSQLEAKKIDFSILDKVFTKQLRSENPEVMTAIINCQNALDEYRLSVHDLNNSVTRKLQNLDTRRAKLQKKIAVLKKSKQMKYLTSLEDDFSDQILQIKNEQTQTREEIHQKISIKQIQVVSVFKNTYLTMSHIYDSTLVRSPVDGIVSRKIASESQHVKQNEKLLNVVPINGQLKLQISVPNDKIANVSLQDEVVVSVDSFPYQRFGQFSGHIESIDKTSNTEKDAFFIVRSSIFPPAEKDRSVASPIVLLPGMKAKAHIRTRELTLYQMIYEKIFAHYFD